MPEVILEGELLPADDGVLPPKLASNDPKRGSRNINVSRRIAELGFNPVDILVHVARGDKEALETEEDIRVFDRRAAASELLSYTTAKPKEAPDEEQLGIIPEFIPKRGIEFLKDREDDDDN